MGKVATATTEMSKPKKRGRPAKATPTKSFNYNSTPSTKHRSTRRNPNNFNSPPQSELDDEDDERKKKKVKLVVRLPRADEKSKVNQRNQNRQHSRDYDSGSDSDPESDDRDMNAGDDGSDDGVPVQEKEDAKVTDSPLHGSSLETGPTAPLPNKKLLVLILDKLQKKDKHGVFSEPVDPEELPDYFETIEQPMDFRTIRKKLERGAYKILDELEHDVVLICSNAMQYNAPSSVYYRQARAIQELSKMEFDNLKHEANDSEPQPKVVRRGRPPGNKNQKKLIETSPVDPETSLGAILATGEDKTTGYNLRKTPALNRFRSADLFMASNRSRNGETYSELLADWNDEFPASILRADMKHSKRWFTVDEKRRDTYRQFDRLSSGGNSPVLSSCIEDVKRLVPVGLQEPLVYARSLARYAANLGPVAWKFASKKIEIALPSGIQYGPGWVGDNGTTSQPLSFSIPHKQKSSNSAFTPSTSDISSAIANNNPSEAMVEAVRKLNSLNEPFVNGEASSLRTPFPSQQKLTNQSHRNGINPSEMVQSENWSTVQSGYPVEQVKGSASQRQAGMWNFGKSSWPTLPMQQKHSVSLPPDLNVRVPVGSPSRVKIGSPQQPDLALQL